MTDHRGEFTRRAAAVVATLACFLAASSARTQTEPEPEPLTVALFAPGVYFDDSVARAGFVSSFAAELEARLERPVRGVNLSSASDLSDADIAIVDGMYLAGSSTGTPIMSARRDGSTSASLSLVVASSGPTRLADLRGTRLILPRSGGLLESLVSNRFLRGELEADEFFESIELTSNVESALSAVESGRAAAPLAVSARGPGGRRALAWGPPGPRAVVVLLETDLDDATREAVREVAAGASSIGFSGFGSFDSGALTDFRGRANRGRATREPRLATSRRVEVEAGRIRLPEPESEGIAPPAEAELIAIPEIDP